MIAAEGEQKSSRALREAAVVISENPAALQLRYLQTLNGIAAEHNSTIIFPLPIELITSWGGPGADPSGTGRGSVGGGGGGNGPKVISTPGSFARTLDTSGILPID